MIQPRCSFFFPDHQDKDRQKAETCSKGSEWYIVFISIIVGIVLGLVLLYGSQWIRRKRAMGTQHRTCKVPNTQIPNHPTTSTASRLGTRVTGDTHVYTQPIALTMCSTNYEELNVVRANEKNPYQDLRLTTRMKAAAEKTNNG